MLVKRLNPKSFPAVPQQSNYNYYFVAIENGDTFWAAVKTDTDKKLVRLLSVTYDDSKDKIGILPFPCKAYDPSSSLEDDLHDFYRNNVEVREYTEEEECDAFAGYYSEFDY